MTSAAWSFSSIKTFDQCPKKYYHLKVAKDTKDEGSEATIYGTEVHEAAEKFVRDAEPIPEKYKVIRPVVEALMQFPGEKHVELKLGVKKDANGEYAPCDFFDPDVWYRGIVDLLIVSNRRAWIVDYKTGKSARYADTKQLDLMAGAVFVHYPEVYVIKSGLAFVVSNEFISKVHVRGNRREYLNVFSDQLERLEGAHQSGVWNAKPSGLCPWCPVTSCGHWTQRRR
jgi:CRISPR/Cas system-associated exonuclease Cas4 (RecB family)